MWSILSLQPWLTVQQILSSPDGSPLKYATLWGSAVDAEDCHAPWFVSCSMWVLGVVVSGDVG